MELRPHHLLCIQGYHGVGYSESFVTNMSKVVKKLQENPKQQITVNKRYDVLCDACPEKEKNCSSCEQKGLAVYLDNKTLEWLGIKEGNHVYEDLMLYIVENLKWEAYFKICSKCEWFIRDVCLLKKKFLLECE